MFPKKHKSFISYRDPVIWFSIFDSIPFYFLDTTSHCWYLMMEVKFDRFSLVILNHWTSSYPPKQLLLHSNLGPSLQETIFNYRVTCVPTCCWNYEVLGIEGGTFKKRYWGRKKDKRKWFDINWDVLQCIAMLIKPSALTHMSTNHNPN